MTGIDADEYMEWEIAIDNIFATRFMCPRRKVKNASSFLRLSALTWWESLSPLDKPQTWDYMKFLMRETFANPSHVVNSYDEGHQLEDQSIVVYPAMPNLLQETEQMQEDKDDGKQNEELTTSCENQNLHLIIHLVLLLKMRAKVMRGQRHSRMVRLLSMC